MPSQYGLGSTANCLGGTHRSTVHPKLSTQGHPSITLTKVTISYYRIQLSLLYTIYSSLVCVCVFFLLPIRSGHQVRWTYQPRGHTGERSHRIFHPPSFCGACLNFSREKDSVIPFPRRPRFNRSPLVGHFFFFFFFLVRKILFAGIELTSRRVRRLGGYLLATRATG